MDPNNFLRQQLIDLGAETLADSLIKLAEKNDEVDNLVERLVAKPSENIKRFKNKLVGLKKAQRFIDWRGVSQFARELEGLLEDLHSGVKDPRVGAEMVASFYECDESVFNRCDDSTGIIGDIFRITARDYFIQYAAACTDKEWIADKLINLYSKDHYGVRSALIESANKFLNNKQTRIE
jgi:hypothetical protein